MACEIVKCRGGLFVVWGTPSAEDMDRVLDELTEAAQSNGGKAIYITRVPVGAPPPANEARDRFNAVLPRLMAQVSSYHVVMEGTGFVAAFKRATLTTLLQPFWRRRVFYVHATCNDALAQTDASFHHVAQHLIRLAESRGLTQGPLPANPAPQPSA